MNNETAVKLKLTQTTASYRRPGSFVVRESYPLPPYSTVIGFVHAACGFTEYVPMRVSVRGVSAGGVSEPYTHYSFNAGGGYEEGRHNVKICDAEKTYGIMRGLSHVEMLCDVELCLHIMLENASMTDAIFDGLRHPMEFPTIGRREDLVRIDSVKKVRIDNRTAEELYDEYIEPFAKYGAYIPLDEANRMGQTGGTRYRLNKVFMRDEKDGVRKWPERVEAVYVGAGTEFNADESCAVYVDEDGEIVFPV